MFKKSTFGRGGTDNCMASADYTLAFENDFTITPKSCVLDKSCDSGYRSFRAINNSNPNIVTSACCTCNKNCVGKQCPECKLLYKGNSEYGSENCFASSSESSSTPSQSNKEGPYVNASYTDCANKKYKSENAYIQCMRFDELTGRSSSVPEHGPLHSSKSSSFSYDNVLEDKDIEDNSIEDNSIENKDSTPKDINDLSSPPKDIINSLLLQQINNKKLPDKQINPFYLFILLILFVVIGFVGYKKFHKKMVYKFGRR